MPPDPESGKADAAPEARYANHFEVGYNEFEFLLDFAQAYGDAPGVQPHTRVVTAPAYTAVLLELLRASVASYESEYGAIPPARRSGDE